MDIVDARATTQEAILAQAMGQAETLSRVSGTAR
jgi:hypothetical protein